MKKLILSLGGLAGALGLAACSGNNTQVPVTAVNIGGQSVLQFAVGKANIFNGAATGMNVVATFRQPNGQSAVLLDTPTLTGPFTLPASTTSANSVGSTASTGPSAAETSGSACGGTPCITGTPQQPVGQPVSLFPFISTFGTSGGVFGLAFAPANSTAGSTNNAYQPYPVPIYASAVSATKTNQFLPWGGPPAYDPDGTGKGTRDGTFGDITRGLLGVSLGLDVFNSVTANAGTYNLAVNVPTTNSNIPFNASTTFAGGGTLPNITPPTITFDGTGQASVSYTLPAGLVGAYVEVWDQGPALCNAAGNINLYGAGTSGNPGASAQPNIYYTFWVTSSGTVTVTNKMSPGPPGSAFPAICTQAQNRASALSAGTETGDAVVAYVIGFDYNHYALTYNGPLGSTYPARPALPAAADVSVSTPGSATSP